MAERVRFPGPHHPVEEALSALDVFAFPSRWEPFGLAALEAMSLGLPVVASRVGGLPEFITDEREGLLVPPGDPVALAAALRRLAGDEPLRLRLGQAGAARALGCHDAAMAEGYERVYRRAMRAGGV